MQLLIKPLQLILLAHDGPIALPPILCLLLLRVDAMQLVCLLPLPLPVSAPAHKHPDVDIPTVRLWKPHLAEYVDPILHAHSIQPPMHFSD